MAEYAVQHRESWLDLPQDDAVKLLRGTPWSQRDAAADRGSVIHNVIEAYLKGEPMPDCTAEELDVAIAAERFLLDHKPRIYGVEVTVYSPTYGYAGTCDLWCQIDGEPWLLDWKTGKDAYPEYAVQLLAYALAERAVLHGEDVAWNPGTDGALPRLGIVHLTAKKYTLHRVDTELSELARVWPALLEVHRWMQVEKDALSVARVSEMENVI